MKEEQTQEAVIVYQEEKIRKIKETGQTYLARVIVLRITLPWPINRFWILQSEYGDEEEIDQRRTVIQDARSNADAQRRGIAVFDGLAARLAVEPGQPIDREPAAF